MELTELLEGAPYPGRVVVVGTAPDGTGWWAYAVTGRSEASRARRAAVDGGRVDVVPTDEGAAVDDLRHYTAVLADDDRLAVGNGAHVEPVAEAVDGGARMVDAVSELLPEPDAIGTPRLVAVARRSEAGWAPVWMAGVRPATVYEDPAERITLGVAQPVPGWAAVVKTYVGDPADVVPDAQPRVVACAAAADEALDAVWGALDPAYRVLAVGGAAGGAVRDLSARGAATT